MSPFARAASVLVAIAAKSLVPATGTILERKQGDCVEFASEPSCADVYYTNPGRRHADRVKLVRDAAAAGHWTPDGESTLATATWLRYRRGSLRGSVWVLADQRAAQCAEAPRRDCADQVHVVRD
jgi:hypothetical protein